MPYVWRPKILVSGARTVAQLWELTKRIGRGNGLLTFEMEIADRWSFAVHSDKHSR